MGRTRHRILDNTILKEDVSILWSVIASTFVFNQEKISRPHTLSTINTYVDEIIFLSSRTVTTDTKCSIGMNPPGLAMLKLLWAPAKRNPCYVVSLLFHLKHFLSSLVVGRRNVCTILLSPPAGQLICSSV